ncbi:MAG: sigma 54-interacting transcriptional regulator [Gemmatimonadaceae bacterium]
MTNEGDADRRHALSQYTVDDFTSEDASMRGCLELARIAARTDLPVLILGESGTGKTLLARAIHNSSRRAGGSFVAFNAAALSETLLDSQLFGHEKGAFTGALKRVKGKFELADRGTLFIDEIADMSAAAQAKILRAVEYGEFERLGSETLLVADVRLISATHLPLGRYMQSDQFRKDLFYRISGITVSVPPLRSRPGDLRSLIAAEIAAASRREGRAITGMSKRAADALFAYQWPGNLRELKQVLHSAVAMTEGEVIQADAVRLDGSGPKLEEDGRGPAGRGVGDALADDAHVLAVAASAGRGDGREDDLTLKAVERQHIYKVLTLTHGNKRQAAKLLGLSRSTLDRKLSSDDGLLADMYGHMHDHAHSHAPASLPGTVPAPK